MKILLVFILSIFTSLARASNQPLPTVEKVDLQRYLGTWHEIARFDQRFQKGCTATTATYSKLPSGDIEVLNKCYLNTPDGELKVSKGIAWSVSPETNSKLKVQFFLKFIKISFLSGNYWILALDDDYQYAMVGDPSRKYLWILSRSPQMDKSNLDKLISLAQKLGFDTDKLLITKQK